MVLQSTVVNTPIRTNAHAQTVKRTYTHSQSYSRTYLAHMCTLQTFFRQYGPLKNAPYGINPEIMDTYVKSCGKLCCRDVT